MPLSHLVQRIQASLGFVLKPFSSLAVCYIDRLPRSPRSGNYEIHLVSRVIVFNHTIHNTLFIWTRTKKIFDDGYIFLAWGQAAKVQWGKVCQSHPWSIPSLNWAPVTSAYSYRRTFSRLLGWEKGKKRANYKSVSFQKQLFPTEKNIKGG